VGLGCLKDNATSVILLSSPEDKFFTTNIKRDLLKEAPLPPPEMAKSVVAISTSIRAIPSSTAAAFYTSMVEHYFDALQLKATKSLMRELGEFVTKALRYTSEAGLPNDLPSLGDKLDALVAEAKTRKVV
jgi:hypothetical protein